MAETKSVKVIHGALHESSLRGGSIILRGVIDAQSLNNLLVDDYQREVLPLASLKSLMGAIKSGSPLPDIEIGMRGSRTRDVKGEPDAWYLQDECFIIDGQQRVSAGKTSLLVNPGVPVFIGATIHFNTDKAWERERFRVLNSYRVKVAPNVLARNMREDHNLINVLYKLTESDNFGFCLGGRTCWDQNMKRHHLITAFNILKIAGELHQHISPGREKSLFNLANQLNALSEKITASGVRDNIRTFFTYIEEMWGVKNVQYRDLSRHLQASFLVMLARFFSNHHDFWKGPREEKLFIEAPMRAKIASFPINTDPGLAPLASSATATLTTIYQMLAEHVNSGKRTKHLRPRKVQSTGLDSNSDE